MASTKLKRLQTIVTADYSFNNFKIGDLAAPVNANDAARKAYVDTEVAGAMTYKGTWDAAANAPAIPAAANIVSALSATDKVRISYLALA